MHCTIASRDQIKILKYEHHIGASGAVFGRTAGMMMRLKCENQTWAIDVKLTHILQYGKVKRRRVVFSGFVVNVCFCSFQISLEMKDVSLLTTPLFLLLLLVSFFPSLSPCLTLHL